jgi:hypothetical protein
MMDMKQLVSEFKALLNGYNFKQKGTSRQFFYDCDWYFIVTHFETIKNGFAIITGINYWWNTDKAATYVIRDDTKWVDFDKLKSLADESVYINSRREYLQERYKTPMDMIQYFNRRKNVATGEITKEIDAYPHEYILCRATRENNLTKSSVEQIKGLMEMYSKPPYIGSRWNLTPEKFFEIGKDVENLSKMTDADFTMEIIRRININRKKQKISILEKLII